MAELKMRPVTQLTEAWAISEIRNTGREQMTHDMHRITRREQSLWFEDHYKPGRELGEMYAFIGTVGLAGAAYGMIKRKDEQYWVTGVVDPEFRGKGFGRALFEFLEGYVFDELNGDRVMLDVLETNTGARALYDKLGYMALYEEAGLIVMQKGRPNVAA